MNQEKIYDHFEQLADQLNIIILVGKGDFEGGNCKLNDDRFVVLNKARPLEQRLRVLAQSFGNIDLEDRYIMPALRKFIDSNSIDNSSAN